MLILTGQRRDEVAGMTWEEISGDLGLLDHSGRARQERRRPYRPAPEAGANSPRDGSHGGPAPLPNPVFSGAPAAPSQGGARRRRRWTKPAASRIGRLDHLRRTLATGLQKLGVRLEVTEAVLGHTSGSRAGIVGVYQRYHWSDEKRAALAAWGAHVAAIVEGREAGDNVVPLQAQSR